MRILRNVSIPIGLHHQLRVSFLDCKPGGGLFVSLHAPSPQSGYRIALQLLGVTLHLQLVELHSNKSNTTTTTTPSVSNAQPPSQRPPPSPQQQLSSGLDKYLECIIVWAGSWLFIELAHLDVYLTSIVATGDHKEEDAVCLAIRGLGASVFFQQDTTSRFLFCFVCVCVVDNVFRLHAPLNQSMCCLCMCIFDK